MVGLLATLMVAAAAGMGMGGSGIDALFFARFGVQYLPTMYIAVGVVTLITMLVTSALLGRVDQRALYIAVPLLLSLILAAERGVLLLDFAWFYPVMWLAKGVMGSLQSLSAWGLASAICDTRQAKRLFPLFSAGSILGTVLGSSLTPVVVNILHSENLILVWAVTMAISYALGRALISGMPAPTRKARKGKQPNIFSEMRQGFDFVRRSRLLALIVVSAYLFSIAWFSLEFPFNRAATTAFPNEDALAGFLGIFMGVNTAVALLLSLFAANRLFARFGIMPMILIFPLIYVTGFVTLTFIAPFPLLAAFRFAQIAWVSGVAGTAWQAMFNVIPAQRRDQARAFMSGVPEPAGTISAGILLNVAQRFLQPQQVYLIGLGAAVPILIILWRATSAYRAALIDALRAGQPQVFYSEEEPFGGFARDATAVAALVESVRSSDPIIRRVSIEVLGNQPVRQAAEALLGALGDPDGAVRVAALRALARTNEADTLIRAADCLGDPDSEVRQQALEVLRRVGDRLEDIRPKLRALLADPVPAVRARAALLLADSSPKARAALNGMAAEADPEARASAIAALGEWGSPGAIPTVVKGLSDAAMPVRRAAASALAHFDASRVVGLLIGALGDPDRPVRGAAAEALGKLGGPALPAVIAALSNPALEAGALAALENLPAPQAADALSAYARERSADAIHYYRLWQGIAALGANDRAALLADSLLDRATHAAIHALRAASLTGDRAAMALAIDNLRSPSAEQRSNALETLEAMSASAEVIRPLMPIFEPKPSDGTDSTDALLRVMQERDPWLRACGALVAEGSDHWEIKVALDEVAASDPDLLVQATARHALEAPPALEEHPHLAAMEQILFLRRVTLFASLAPAELQTLAAIASEGDYSDGAAICRQGEPGEQLYIITAGEARVVVARGRQQHEVARRRAGDIIGEMSIVSQEPRMASVIADGGVRTLAIARKDFETLLRERPGISLAVMKVLCARLKERSG